MVANTCVLTSFVNQYHYLCSAGYHATLKFSNTEDGKTQDTFDVNLGFLPPPTMFPPPQVPNPYGYEMSKPKNRRKKTPSQLNRDRKRVESFRAKKVAKTDVILPFSGKLLPVKEGATLAESLVDEHGDISDVLGVSTPPEINSTLPSIPAAPLKNSLSLKQLTPDVSTARKELFSTSSPSSIQDADASGTKGVQAKSFGMLFQYEKKEQRLMSKLFDVF